jgi:ABC-type polar amino acid transport system ATPase subunit
MIKIEKIHKSFNGTEVLKGSPSKWTRRSYSIGRSGYGKSVL